MFTLTNFLATSKHYFVAAAPSPSHHGFSTAYADQAHSSNWEELVLGVVSVLTALTAMSAVVIAA